MFSPLSRNDIKDIVRLQINALSSMLAKRDIHLTVDENAIEVLCEEGYDPQYGARPIKRVIQRDLMNSLSRSIISGEIEPASQITIGAENGQLTFKNS
jgi:ATP-dependent Clp protease ATP-binding subunit ClpB